MDWRAKEGLMMYTGYFCDAYNNLDYLRARRSANRMSDDDCNDGSLAETEVVELHHEWDGDARVGETVLQGVAAVTNTPPTKFTPPLYDVVDPDALDSLFQPAADVSRDGEGALTLPLYGCTVTLHPDGTIRIQSPSQS